MISESTYGQLNILHNKNCFFDVLFCIFVFAHPLFLIERSKRSKHFKFEQRDPVLMKGKGHVVTYICTPAALSPQATVGFKRQNSVGLPLVRSRSIMAMNFYQFLNSEETKANAMTLKFTTNSSSQLQVIPEESELLGNRDFMGTKMTTNRKKLFQDSKMDLYSIK